MESIGLKILNINALSIIEEEIKRIEDKQEREKRYQLLDAIWDKISDYDIHILEYEYQQHMKKLIQRGIDFVPADRPVLEASWDRCFANLVSEEAKKQNKQYNEQFKWHLFSFELLDSLKADDANAKFNAIVKDTVSLFFENSEEAYIIRNASLLNADDFDFDCDMTKADLYVFDPVAQWTYIKTHEATCGPYFYCAKEK